MTPEQAKAAYRRQIDAHGEAVTLRKGFDGAEISVRVRVTGFQPEQLVGSVTLGHRRIVILAEDVPSSWGVPQKNDRVIVGALTLTVQHVDSSTRRVAGETVAFDLTATGA
ncbi:hypothetical protein ACUSIJ_24970 [Pseudochelatococcus sp. B33]